MTEAAGQADAARLPLAGVRIVDISKADINDKVKPEFKQLYDIIKAGFHEEKLMVPQSEFHEIETSLAPDLKERIVRFQNFIGQVSLNRDRRAAGGGDLLERLPKRSVVFGIGFHGAGGEPDRGAFVGQSRSDRLPQAAAGARDQSDFASAGSCHFRPASHCAFVCARTPSP